MSSLMTHAVIVGVPLVLTAILAALIWRGKGPHPATYRLSEPWTHEPILWAADEPAVHGHSAGHFPLTIGGGASGKW